MNLKKKKYKKKNKEFNINESCTNNEINYKFSLWRKMRNEILPYILSLISLNNHIFLILVFEYRRFHFNEIFNIRNKGC